MIEAIYEFTQPPEEKPRKKAESRQGLSDYEKFWVDLEAENPLDYVRHWTPERRKSFLEDGAEFLVDVRDQGIQTMVFMDRSARPLALFLRALWRRIYPDQQPPEMRFAVGKRDWEIEKEGSDQLKKEIYNLYRKADFDGKNVLFIDEEFVTGETLMTTSDLFKQAFPGMRINFGALSVAGSTANELLTIQPPTGSDYKALFAGQYPGNLAQVIHNAKSSHRQTEVKEQSGSILAKRRTMPQKAKWTYRLMLVGKNQTLDEKSLQGIDERIAIVEIDERITETKIEEERERLRKIREAYEKLIKT